MKILAVDGLAADHTAPPIDIERAAQADGIDTTYGFTERYELVIEEVVTPLDLVAHGPFGRERVRPTLSPGVLARLRRYPPMDGSLLTQLRAALVGCPLAERARPFSPVAMTSDGRRLVAIETLDGEPIEELFADLMDDTASGAPDGTNDLDFADVPCDAASLRAGVAEAVALAERHSPYRAPADLDVRWISMDDPPRLTAEQVETVRAYDPILAQGGRSLLDALTDTYWGASLPGGFVFLNEDREWHALLLRVVLVHELMHQHLGELRLADLGVQALPYEVEEAFTSSWTLEILRRGGVDSTRIDDSLSFEASATSYSNLRQAFDALRAQADLDPDAYLLYLATHPEAVERFQRWSGLGMASCTEVSEESSGTGPLRFELLRENGRPLVAIVNTTDRPFAGFCNGWWHTPGHLTGGPPFALRLPPRGRVVVALGQGTVGLEARSFLHAVYRETPSAVFDG